MGKNFLRAKSERFSRQRDKAMLRAQAPDLYSSVEPAQRTEVLAVACAPADLGEGAELWASLQGGGPIDFFRGDRRAATVGTETAMTLRSAASSSGYLTAVVSGPLTRLGMVSLEIRSDGGSG